LCRHSMADPKKTDAVVPDDSAAPKPSVGRKALTHEDRLSLLVEDVSKRSPPAVAEYIKKAKPIIVPVLVVLVQILDFVGPIYVKVAVAIYNFLVALPWDLFQAAMGLGLCFFGGHYLASIAAVEAFNMTGWATTQRQLELIYEDAVAIVAANKKDDDRDDDGDGIADVKQIATSELIDRKVRVAAGAVKDPQRLSAALGGLYVGWLSVQGVLRVKFAKTINLAVACSQFVEYYVCKALLPVLSPLLADEFRSWLPVAIKTTTKGFFVYFAWKLQEVVSAAQSGMRGGLMFSRGVANFLNKRGYTSVLGFSIEHEKTYLDELVGYLLAAAGFYVQWSLGFALPFPFNIVMFPMDCVEWYIRWTITSDAPPA